MVVERRDEQERVDLSPFSLIPKYDSLSLFLLSVIFILLSICYHDAIKELWASYSLSKSGDIYILCIVLSVFFGGFIALGTLFSVVRIFY